MHDLKKLLVENEIDADKFIEIVSISGKIDCVVEKLEKLFGQPNIYIYNTNLYVLYIYCYVLYYYIICYLPYIAISIYYIIMTVYVCIYTVYMLLL